MDFQTDIEGLIRSSVSRLVDELADGVGRHSLSDIVESTQETVNELGVQLIERLYQEVDRLFDERRDKHKIVIKNCSKTRRLLTSMGEVKLRRKLYFEKQTARYFFAVDEILQLQKYERIERNLQADLVSKATLTSYGKASEFAGRRVSRQTVHNLVKRIDTDAITVPSCAPPLRTVGDIFIEADEDHIHLNTGKSAEVKLVYVHEGARPVCRGRAELVNPRYFVSIDNEADDLWADVADYLYSTYRCSQAAIHISGDGANWIKGGLNYFPKASYHLDKFHVFKSVTGASFGDKRLRDNIVAALYEKDFDTLRALYQNTYQSKQKLSERKTVSEGLFYLENNFDEIDLTPAYSCAAEGHVSHVLSARLSSRPMGWSIEGADRIARLRAFYFNGGEFRALVYRDKNTKEKEVHYTMRARPNRKPSKVMPMSAHVVGLDGVTNGLSATIRAILKRGTRR